MGAEDDLIVEYRRRLPARVADMEGQAARAEWPALCRAVHKLRGSAALYGFPELSRIAAELEELLIATEPAPTGDAENEAFRLLRDLRREIELETGSGA